MKSLIFAFMALFLATTASAQDANYRIQPGDTLRVEVLQDPSLNRNVIVLPDGRFSFPFAGTVQAGGQTLDQVESNVANAISGNFQTSPNVFVSILTLTQRAATRTAAAPVSSGRASISVYFIGEVGAPGEKELASGTTLLQALAKSGGLTNFAAQKRIQLRRTDARTGKQALYKLNLKALMDGADGGNLHNLILQNGDVILVPERRLFE